MITNRSIETQTRVKVHVDRICFFMLSLYSLLSFKTEHAKEKIHETEMV